MAATTLAGLDQQFGACHSIGRGGMDFGAWAENLLRGLRNCLQRSIRPFACFPIKSDSYHAVYCFCCFTQPDFNVR